MAYDKNRVKQFHIVEYLGCCLDTDLNGESTAMKFLEKKNATLQFLYRQIEFLKSQLRRLLCNSLFQPHFDYACVS